MSKRTRFNGNRSEVKALRQLAVAGELARGRSEREIRDALDGQGNVNPRTGAPWSLGIIHRDCEELQAQWRAEAAAAIADVKGRQLAEIREARRMAWRLADVNQVRQLLKLEMELMGTEAPRRQEVMGKDGGPVLVEHAGEVHGGVEHVAAVLATLAAVGAIPLPADVGGDAAEDDELHQRDADA